MNKKAIALALICFMVVMAGFVVAVTSGAKSISLKIVWDSIFHYEEILDMQLVRDGRLPRVICTALIGGFLGLSGAMMQGVTRNPIAEPSLMGITQGATLAVVIVSLNPRLYGLLGNITAALVGATCSGFLVLLFSMQNPRNMNISRLLLAGTALSTFFISMASMIALLSNRSQELAFWVAGGFRTATWSSVWMLLIIGGVSTIAALRMSRRINIVNIGEDIAIGLGENPVKTRVQTMLILIPICAVSVAIAGNIAFVGLVVPHIIRKLIGSDYLYIMPLSFIGGSCLLVWADIAARLVNQPYETPIGLFTCLMGVPFFLWMVRKENG